MDGRTDIWNFTPVFYRTLTLWGRCPETTRYSKILWMDGRQGVESTKNASPNLFGKNKLIFFLTTMKCFFFASFLFTHFFYSFSSKVTHLARLYPLVTCYTLLYWLVSRSIDPLLGSGPSFVCFFSIPLPLESQFQGPNSSLEAGGPDICSRPKSKSQCPNPSLKPQILASRLVFGPQD